VQVTTNDVWSFRLPPVGDDKDGDSPKVTSLPTLAQGTITALGS
jgi:hypothetical protein